MRSVPRSWLLSAGSGIAVAYVFVHLLPELAEVQERLAEAVAGGWLSYLETHAWIVALVGLGVFYGLELAARRRGPGSHEVGWIHISSYAIYNGVVGYLLHQRAQTGLTTFVLFAVAMAVHFVVNDHGLREHHAELYEGPGRWIAAGGVLAGWALGTVVSVTEAALGLLIAFLGGGIVMNVLKEELPEDRESRWTAFVGGAAAYTALLVIA